jgi:putative phosphotransacetylase
LEENEMENLVPVSLSNRHIHLTREHLDILFGKGFELTWMKDLSQPGQFAANEKVDIVGPKSTIKGMRILGPLRPETQVEISMFDARTLGVEGLVRLSGNLKGTPGCTIIGPKGQVEIKEGS